MIRYYTLLIISNKTLERMVYVHVNTRLMDQISDIDYKKVNVEWMRWLATVTVIRRFELTSRNLDFFVT